MPKARPVGVSPEAVSARLDELSQLYKLGISLQKARIIGPAEPGGKTDEPCRSRPEDPIRHG